MDELKLKFVGIDSFNRPIFKHGSYFYGSTNTLFNYETEGRKIIRELKTKDLNDEIRFFGTYFDCEPMGSRIKDKKIILEL